ncbi:MAG TPA: hypothetical protein VLM85_30000, partial [Polyangiaceae bacterium]|nr:hypothetical protein [Polyangiaceae bacterium]
GRSYEARHRSWRRGAQDRTGEADARARALTWWVARISFALLLKATSCARPGMLDPANLVDETPAAGDGRAAP